MHERDRAGDEDELLAHQPDAGHVMHLAGDLRGVVYLAVHEDDVAGRLAAGFTGTTWPVTSQWNRWRMEASCCFTVGAASSWAWFSIQVATCCGATAAIDGTPASAH